MVLWPVESNATGLPPQPALCSPLETQGVTLAWTSLPFVHPSDLSSRVPSPVRPTLTPPSRPAWSFPSHTTATQHLPPGLELLASRFFFLPY